MKVTLTRRNDPNGAIYESLTVGREYEVLGIGADWFRLLDDQAEPLLFNPACFRVIDAAEPANWVSLIEDGCRYAGPAEWARPGFFEDWHDGVPEVKAMFWQQLSRWHPNTAEQFRNRQC